MSDLIKELPILSSTGEVLFGTDSYIIPLYQRAFAWEDKQIAQLINDIDSISGTGNYYLGNLIVHKRQDDGKFEVIDGQQRLTALFLILSKLGFVISENALTYQHRGKSIKALMAAQQQNAVTSSNSIDWEGADDRIRQAFQKEIKIERQSEFREKLKRVMIVRIEVPEHTNLNKYFEIMNSRGEQLELADILKAKLMATLKNDKERITFSRIWVACSNMNGYMQMHLKKQEREHYFDWEWTTIPKTNEKLFFYTDDNSGNTLSTASINDIITGKFTGKSIVDVEEADDTLRFDSFVTFNYFLLHTLRVFMGKADDGGLLDDKKLITDFVVAIDEKKASGVSERDFALDFIRCLMRCRFLFDNYIIKRERLKDDGESTADGDGREWSLKRLMTYWGNDKRYGKSYLKPNYVNTAGAILEMLQSMLRVTYTSPKVMHWVTKHLAFLYSKSDIDIADAESHLETFAQQEVDKNYLSGGNFEVGLDTHHIVFNYLDYLLWVKQGKPTIFKFEFRNSVEHWYPQHPLDGNPPWNNAPLNGLGNLCLVSNSLNSKFSNNLPMAKKKNFGASLSKQSLKLREMADKTNDNDDWSADKSQVHGDEMIAMLKASIGVGNE